MKKKFIVAALTFFAVFYAVQVNIFASPANVFEETGGGAVFPALHINTPESPFAERNLWQNGTVSVTNAPQGQNFAQANARVRGRGNSTWFYGEEKRPLRLRFDTPRPLFGADYAAADWILLANHFDPSLLRNYAALYLSREKNMHSIQTLQNVHLFVNGEYMGVYLLTDERDVGAGRLEIAWHENPALSGFFFELDFRAPASGTENESFVVVSGRPYDIRFPSGRRRRTPAHVEYAQDFLSRVCVAIRTQNFAEISRLTDLPSFVDFYLVQEIFKNSDGSISQFMYIGGVGEQRRLRMGPTWDFDISAGLCSGAPLGRYDDQVIVPGLFCLWYRNLLEIPEFRELVISRWHEIRENEIPQMQARLNTLATNYRAQFERNFVRHPFDGGDIFAAENIFLQNWLASRIIFLDEFFAKENPDTLAPLVEFYAAAPPARIYFGGERLAFETEPILLNERIMLPIHELPFAASATTAGRVTISNPAVTVTGRVGSPIFSVNGNSQDFIVAALRTGDAIFVPLRPVAEALGYTVTWRGGAIFIAPPTHTN